jgi:hypothetical protein
LQTFAGTTPEITSFAADLGHELDAGILAWGGAPEQALEALLEARYWERQRGWMGFAEGSFLEDLLVYRPMFLRAELLRQAGRSAEAAIWYRVVSDGSWFRNPALHALAAIHDAAGRGAEAEMMRRQAAESWREADSDVGVRGEVRP